MIRHRKAVLLVGIDVPPTRGGRGVGVELAHQLRATGWQVSTTSSRSGRLGRMADMLATAWRSRSRYDVAQIDVFSGLSFTWAEATAGLLRVLGKPFILTLHGGALPSFANAWPRRTRRLLVAADRVTAPSAYLAQELRSLCGTIEVIPNGLNLADYEFRTREALRPEFLWIRAFHEVYRPWVAVEALEIVRREFPEARLRMIGPDKGDGSLAKCRAHRESLGLQAALDFVGSVEKTEVPLQLQKSDVFLNTSSVDNAPVTVTEAMACGLCVVSTDVGGVSKLLADGRSGLLVPPDDPVAMARAIMGLLEEPETARNLAARARRSVEKHDWKEVLPKWESLLTGLAGNA